MAFKDLLVQVNNSRHCAQRLDVAADLAKAFDAHLAGLYIPPSLDVPAFMTAQLTPDLLLLQRQTLAEARGRAKALFDEHMRKAGIDGEWREAEGEQGMIAALHARYADLMVIGQRDPDEPLPERELDVAERVVMESGRPVLMVPYAGTYSVPGRRALVAWNASPQAVRAVNDALPLLVRAKEVVVLAVNPSGGRNGHGDVPGADIALHLARHGVKAEANRVYSDDVEVGDMILSCAAELGSDLIVMGAYGHARLREMVLGGVTRSLFEQMTAPVFMSH